LNSIIVDSQATDNPRYFNITDYLVARWGPRLTMTTCPLWSSPTLL